MFITTNFDDRLFFSPPNDDGTATDEEIREAGFAKLATRYNNDGVKLAQDLYAENYQLRRKNAELNTANADLKGKVPGDGTVILSGDQALQWTAYQGIGTPDKVKEQLAERDQLQGKLDTVSREKVLRDVADNSKFVYDVLVDADALAERKLGSKPTYEVREVEANGQKVKTAFVKVGDAEKPIADFAQEHWGHLISSLVVTENGTHQTGTQFPSQHQGSGGGNKPQTTLQQTQTTLKNTYNPPSRAKT